MESKPTLALEIKIIDGILGCAKEKLLEDPEYLFRFNIDRKNFQNSKNDKKKSKKVKLKEGTMDFNNDSIKFYDINTEDDYLEISMAIGNSNSGKRFKPVTKRIKDMTINNETNDTWLLTSQSIVNVLYNIFNESEGIQIQKECNDTDSRTSKIKLPKNVVILPDLVLKKAKKSKNDYDILKNTNNIVIDSNTISTDIKNQFDNISTIQDDSTSRKTSTVLTEQGVKIADINEAEEKRNSIKNLVNFFENLTSKTNQISKRNSKTYEDAASNNTFDTRITTSSIVSIDTPYKKVNREFGKKDRTHVNTEIEQDIERSFSKISNQNKQPEANTSSKIIIDYETSSDSSNLNESFCKAFFIASIPNSNAKLISESEEIVATCGHSDCSILPAYKPEIIMRYPLKDDDKLEINSLTASLCFPSGVKLCYNENIKIKNFSTCITNQDGSRYYMMTYHFYIKIDNGIFDDIYDANPIKEVLAGQKSLISELNEAARKRLEEKLEKQYELITSLNFCDYVNVPMCACFISKYPYTKQMEQVLDQVIKMCIDNKYSNEDVYKIIVHCIKEIPIPPNNSRLLFYIPFTNQFIELISPIYKELPIINNNLANLMYLFSIDNLITIHYLMILEQRILFVCDDYNQLTDVIDSFVSLLYPFEWIHTYIPILSEEMIKYLQSFMPFIMGIDDSLIETAKQYLQEEENIYIVHIKKNLVDVSSNKKGKKLKRKELVKDLPELPADIESEITKKFKNFQRLFEKNGNVTLSSMEFYIREIFIRCHSQLFGDYVDYLSILNNEDIPIFDSYSFLSKKGKSKDFCKEIIDTQLFINFIQNEGKEEYAYFRKISSMNKILEIDETSFSRRRSISSKSSLRSISQDYGPPSIDNKDELISLDKKDEFKETYIILPYFIETDFKKDLNKISLYINEVYPTSKKRNLIFNYENFKKLKFEDIPNAFNRYTFISKNNVFEKKDSIKPISSKIRPFVIQYEKKLENQLIDMKYIEGRKATLIYKTKRKNELSPSELEEVKNLINEYLKLILRSEPISNVQFMNMNDLFTKSNEGKSIFAKLLYQCKFKEYKDHYLTEESYINLEKIIFKALLESKDDNKETYDNVYLLTKSCFHYYKTINDKNIYIFQTLSNHKGSFTVWKKYEFWLKWFDNELKDVKNIIPNKEDMSMNIIKSIINTMFMLKIDNMVILTCIIGNLAISLIKDAEKNKILKDFYKFKENEYKK